MSNNRMGRKYKNPPVVEALCEIFFSGSKWDSTLPGLFFEKIKDNYPKKSELEQVGVEVSISKNIQGSKIMHGEKRIQFAKKDNSQLVQIERDLLVVNQLKPYPRFEDWKPAVDKRRKDKMTKLAILGAPYDYVQTEDVVSDVVSLLRLDRALSGTDPASIVITREKSGTVDLLQLRGLGKNLWKGIDAQGYINKLREEWEK